MLGKKGPLLVLQNIVSSLVGLVGLFFVGRYLPVAWSILSFGIAFAGLFSMVGDLGFSTANVKLQSQGEDEGVCNSTFLVSKLIFNSAYVLITFGALMIWVYGLHHGFQYKEEFWVVLALIPYYFFYGMIRYTNSYYTTKLKPARIVIPSIVEVVMRNSIFVFIAVAFTVHFKGISQQDAAVVLSVVYSFTYTIYFLFAFLLGRPWKFSKPSFAIFKKYWVIAIPLGLSLAISTLNQNVDKIIIQFYWTSRATGSFFLDQKLINVLITFSTSVSIFFLPLLSRLDKGGTKDQFNVSVKEYERLITMFSLPGAVAFGVFSLYIVNIFNGYFTDYAYLLSMLALYAMIRLNAIPYTNALIATGKQKSVGLINVIGLSTNIALNLITVPSEFLGVHYLSLGVAGAAFSTIVAATLMNIAYRVRLYYSSGTKFNFEVLKLMVPTAIEFSFLYVAQMCVRPFSIVILAPLLVAALLIFTGVTVLIGELSISEIMTFVKNLNPLKLTRALKEE